MNANYSDASSWKYSLDKEAADALATEFNISNYQIQFMYQLVNGKYYKLVELLVKKRRNGITGIPSNESDCDSILFGIDIEILSELSKLRREIESIKLNNFFIDRSSRLFKLLKFVHLAK